MYEQLNTHSFDKLAEGCESPWAKSPEKQTALDTVVNELIQVSIYT